MKHHCNAAVVKTHVRGKKIIPHWTQAANTSILCASLSHYMYYTNEVVPALFADMFSLFVDIEMINGLYHAHALLAQDSLKFDFSALFYVPRLCF